MLWKRYEEIIGNTFTERCTMIFLIAFVQVMLIDCDDHETCLLSVLKFKVVCTCYEGMPLEMFKVLTLLYASAFAIIQCKGKVNFRSQHQAAVKDL